MTLDYSHCEKLSYKTLTHVTACANSTSVNFCAWAGLRRDLPKEVATIAFHVPNSSKYFFHFNAPLDYIRESV